MIDIVPLSSNGLPNGEQPFITVAIPHYKQRDYLKIVLQSVFTQAYDSFEILVSNDCSPDDSDTTIPKLLEASNCAYQYYSHPKNLGYDGNVRFCLSRASGRYVLLIGNDDALTDTIALQEIYDALQALNFPDVAFTNYSDWESNQVTRRAIKTQVLGTGVETALKFYRSFSFVGGLIFNSEKARKFDTDRWDQSIYYQIYLACRIVSAGGQMGAIDYIPVRKDIKIGGKSVTNYV